MVRNGIRALSTANMMPRRNICGSERIAASMIGTCEAYMLVPSSFGQQIGTDCAGHDGHSEHDEKLYSDHGASPHIMSRLSVRAKRKKAVFGYRSMNGQTYRSIMTRIPRDCQGSGHRHTVVRMRP